MANVTKSLIRTALEALYFSGAHVILSPLCRGVGAVLMLHHVRPPRQHATDDGSDADGVVRATRMPVLLVRHPSAGHGARGTKS